MAKIRLLLKTNNLISCGLSTLKYGTTDITLIRLHNLVLFIEVRNLVLAYAKVLMTDQFEI